MTDLRRVVLIGQSDIGGLGHSLASGFAKSGWDVVAIQNPLWPSELLEAAAYRFPALSAGYRRQFRQIIERLPAQPTHLVLVVKGPFLDYKTIDYIRSRTGAPVICWNPDSPFDRAVSNRGAYLRNAVGAYDLYITWADDVAERIRPINENVLVIPFGWDPELHRDSAIYGAQDEETARDRIVFIGTGSSDRVRILRQLREFRPVIFGNDWPSIDGIEIRRPVFGRDMACIIRQARWNLNLLRPQNALSHNMRTFEVPGCGGNQVAPFSQDHRRYLGDDTRTLLYKSFGELKAILRSDPGDLTPRAPEVLLGHTYTDRVRTLLRRMDLLGA